MRKLLVGLVAFAAVATAAAQEWQQVEAHLKWSVPLAQAGHLGGLAGDPDAYYSNIDSTGFAVANGGAAVVGADRITKLLADKVQPGYDPIGTKVTEMSFAVTNQNQTLNISARPRIRIWDDDGAGGGPGTALAGFTFNPITFTAGSAASFFFNPTQPFGPAQMLDGGAFWIGMTFDNNGTTATLAQLNQLGLFTNDPPTVGSSADTDWLSTAAGSNFVSNPAGAIRSSPFAANPNANYFWEVIPEPTTMALVALGGLFAARRRR